MKVADDDLGADGPERLGAFIFGADGRVDGRAAFAKDLDHLATHSADAAGERP